MIPFLLKSISPNIVEVYDLAGNMTEYQVKLKDTDIPTIDIGLDALTNKDNISSEDISYFRKKFYSQFYNLRNITNEKFHLKTYSTLILI